MKMATAIAVALLLVAAATSCVPKRAVYVRVTNQVELAPSTGGYVLVRAAVRVENHNPRSIHVRDAMFYSWHEGRDLATITLQSPVEVRANSADTVWVPLEVRFSSAGRMLTFALQGGVEDWRNVEVEGYAKIQYGGSSKKFRVSRRKLKELSSL